MDRRFHLVVWGATGFTGRLVCEHIAADYQARQARRHHDCDSAAARVRSWSRQPKRKSSGVQATVGWAMAGRNRAKLEAVRDSLTLTDPSCEVTSGLLKACRLFESAV